jgi:tRNA pseudouridine(55) synthase
MIIINKEIGNTINQTINKYKKDNNIKKACFCGRLDPMARGQVIILIEEECKLMSTYLNKNKKYQFEIIFGLQTDTDDFLGILRNYSFNKFNQIKDLYNYILSFNDKSFNQEFHKYSSKKVNGKTLRNITENIKMPNHNVTVYDIIIIEEKEYEYNIFINNIIKNINSIDKNKDFRQKEIIDQWKDFKYNILRSIKVEISVSSGFYVRQFVRDTSNYFNYPMITYDINRISYF